jgi:hypothetical protein
MRTPVKLAAFGGALALAFTGALGVGAATGSPLGSDDAPVHGHNTSAPAHSEGGHGATTPAAADKLPPGLAISEGGYTLELGKQALNAGPSVELSFRVLTDDGQALRDFEVSHDKQMHTILVRRDTSGFQHVHPVMSPDGTWTVPVALQPGTWRVFADFVPATGPGAGEARTLGADLSVAGSFAPAALPAPSRTAAVDGYEVRLDGDLSAGHEQTLTFTVTRGGQPVRDLQPYLGAFGHLVALRAGDLAYLHVHPEGEAAESATGGPDIAFAASAPTAGTYRLFLDFQHDGKVRTAEFTLPLAAGAGSAVATTAPSAGAGNDSPAGESAPVSPEAEHSSDGHSH